MSGISPGYKASQVGVGTDEIVPRTKTHGDSTLYADLSPGDSKSESEVQTAHPTSQERDDLQTALPEAEDIAAVIACLGDDAAQLRDENAEDERAENMEAAASLLQQLADANAAVAKLLLDQDREGAKAWARGLHISMDHQGGLVVWARAAMPVERIAMLWNSLPLATDAQSVVSFVRAIESFHGIGSSGAACEAVAEAQPSDEGSPTSAVGSPVSAVAGEALQQVRALDKRLAEKIERFCDDDTSDIDPELLALAGQAIEAIARRKSVGAAPGVKENKHG